MPHFPFTELHHDILGPPMGIVKTFVKALAFRLRLSTAELVMAYAFVERALVVNPSLMRIYSVRPISGDEADPRPRNQDARYLRANR